MDILQEVKHTLQKYSDGYTDPFIVARNMGIDILKADLGYTKGYYFKYKRNYIIFINNRLSYRTQKRVCAHELGHAVLHKDSPYAFLCTHARFSLDKYERQADLFAIHFLLSEYDEDNKKNFSFNDIANITGYDLKYIENLFY